MVSSLSPVSLLLFVNQSLVGRRAFTQSATRKSYDDTIQNLLIHKDTKVLVQGFTGKTASHELSDMRREFGIIENAGYLPRKGGFGLWHEDGRRRFTEESRPNSSWPPCFRKREGGV